MGYWSWYSKYDRQYGLTFSVWKKNTYDCEEGEHEAESSHDGDEAVHLRMLVRREHRVLARNAATLHTVHPASLVVGSHERSSTHWRPVENQVAHGRLQEGEVNPQMRFNIDCRKFWKLLYPALSLEVRRIALQVIWPRMLFVNKCTGITSNRAQISARKLHQCLVTVYAFREKSCTEQRLHHFPAAWKEVQSTPLMQLVEHFRYSWKRSKCWKRISISWFQYCKKTWQNITRRKIKINSLMS